MYSLHTSFPLRTAFSFLLFPFHLFYQGLGAPGLLRSPPPPPASAEQSLSVPSSPESGAPPHSQAQCHSSSSSSFSLVLKKSWPEKSVSSPHRLPPLPSGTQKGTEAPDGLVLAEGLREAAAHRGPCWAFALDQAAAQPSSPAGRGGGHGASLLSARPAPPARSPSLPSLPWPTQRGRHAPQLKSSVSLHIRASSTRGRAGWPVGTLGFPRREEEWPAVCSF